MHIRTIITSLVLVLLFSPLVMSQTMVGESFGYPVTIAGLGTASDGWGGSWYVDPTDQDYVDGLATLASNVFNYDDLNWSVPDSGNHVQVTKKNAWSDHCRYKRPLAETWPNQAGKIYWVSYLLDVKEPLPVGNTYFMVKLYHDASELLAIGKAGGGPTPPVYTCGSGWTGEGDDLSNVEIVGGPVWLVVRIDMSGGTGDERTFMWIDPDPTAEPPDTNFAVVKRNSSMPNGINTIALEYGGDGENVQLIFDEIRIASSFSDLTAITPENSPFAGEAFDYPITLAGLGSASDGWGGSWYVDTTDQDYVDGLATLTSNVFNYDDLNWAIPDTGNQVQVTKKNAWSDHCRYKRPLADTWPNVEGNHYWVSYLLDVKEPLPVGNTYFMVKLYYNASELLAIGKAGGGPTPPVYTCGSGWTGEGDDLSNVEIVGGPVWLVVRIDMSGGDGNERTFMWIDPDPSAEPDTNLAIVKRNSTMSSGINTIALEYGGDGENVKLIFDEIRLASDYADLQMIPTSIKKVNTQIPDNFALAQNYPNPFNPETKIAYSISRSGLVKLTVYDILGHKVAVLVNRNQSPGNYEVTFSGENLSTGIYFYQLITSEGMHIKKMALVK